MTQPSPAEQRSQHTIRRYVMSLVVLAVFASGIFIGRSTVPASAAVGTSSASTEVVNRDSNSASVKSVDFKQFWQVWDKVQSKFVRRPGDEQQMMYGAITGMVAALGDPYSVYFTPEIAKQFQEELDGSFSGIGAEVGMKNDRVVVVAPLPESPAEAAGLLPGDYITEINSTSTVGFTVEQAVKEIRGPQGTTVNLTLERDHVKNPIKVTITRKTIELKSVTQQMLPGNVMLMTITSFNDQTLPQFNDAISVAQDKKVAGIILDLRNDPGGFFDGAIAVASEWLEPQDVVVAERGKGGGPRSEFVTNGAHRLRGIPTTVLINGGSASAAEIVAGALQDHGKAKLIGEKSFGKGSVQEYEELADGSALKLTVALWYTPKDRSINELGIQPDIVVTEKKRTEAQDGVAARKDPTKDIVIQRALQFLKTGK